MRNKTFFFSLCLACLLVSACVSKEKYEELEARLADTQTKLEQKGKKHQPEGNSISYYSAVE